MKAKIQKKVFSQDWLSAWEQVGALSRLSIVLGGGILLALAVGIGYIGSLRVAHAKQFYPLVFHTKYLEGIQPGTKIRYQGGVIVGVADAVVSGINDHRIFVRIKKDFHIPRKNVIISLKSWGNFGGKYINIDMHETAIDSDYLQPGETVEIDSVTNSSIVLGEFYRLIKSEKRGELSPLEKKLRGIRSMTYSLSHSAQLQPVNTRRTIRAITDSAGEYFTALKEIGDKSYFTILAVHDEISESIKSAGYVLPHLKLQLQKLSKNLDYSESMPYNLNRKLIHEDTAYYEALEYAKYTRKKMRKFKENPYKLFF